MCMCIRDKNSTVSGVYAHLHVRERHQQHCTKCASLVCDQRHEQRWTTRASCGLPARPQDGASASACGCARRARLSRGACV
eukprot:284222-Rhodomonas_salina.1